jgi:hypothetical protein
MHSFGSMHMATLYTIYRAVLFIRQHLQRGTSLYTLWFTITVLHFLMKCYGDDHCTVFFNGIGVAKSV